MANKLRCAIATDDGRPEIFGTIVKHGMKEESVSKNGNFTLKFEHYYSEEAVASGKERLKEVINATGYDIAQKTFNVLTLGIAESSERLYHDLATEYLEEVYGYWNVENLQYGKYLESITPVTGKIIEGESGYGVIRLQVTNDSALLKTVNVGYTEGSSEIATVIIEPGESSEYVINNSTSDIWVSETVMFRAKLLKT